MHVNHPFAVELFAGKAGFTAACKRHGLPHSIAVDYTAKPASHTTIVRLDLSNPSHQDLIRPLCGHSSCCWVHFGVPCGTASRARNIRLSRRQHGPQPLRSFRHPDGLPHLRRGLRERVHKANALYRFMCQTILRLEKASVAWSVENPLRSFLWQTSFWREIEHRCHYHEAECHHCMFGGKRLKRTRFVSSSSHIRALHVHCDGSHPHEPWKHGQAGFDTAQEAEYPRPLCEAMAEVVIRHTEEVTGQALPAPPEAAGRSALIATGRQPTRQSPSLIKDWDGVHEAHIESLDMLLLARRHLTRCISIGPCTIPCGSRLLRSTPKKGVGRSEAKCMAMSGLSPSLRCKKLNPCTTLKIPEMVKEDAQCVEVVFGLPWSDEGFILQAVKTGHPRHLSSGLPTHVEKAVRAVASRPPHEIVLHRAEWLGKWTQIARDTLKVEASMKASLDPHCQKILAAKRLHLTQMIIDEHGYEDSELARDLARGFELVGQLPTSGILPLDTLVASLPVDDLVSSSAVANQTLRTTLQTSGDDELDQELWRKTLSEKEAGWLKGPVAWESLERGAVVSPRFGLKQGPKVRPIDNLAASQVNNTVTRFETAAVDGVDTIAAMCALTMSCLARAGSSTGLCARTLDLSAAYRQLAIAKSSLSFAYIAVFNPESRKAEVFQQMSLPFGARASVNAFIRASKFLQWVACECLLLPVTAYFDDFVVVSTPALCKSSEAAFTLMFRLLGWAFDETGPKADEFSHLISALGVIFDLSRSVEGTITVCNTEKRIAELVESLSKVAAGSVLSKSEALKLRGRVGFASAQIFGRATNLAMQILTQHAYAEPFVPELSSETKSAVKYIANRLRSGPPRSIACNSLGTIYMFTDASFERGDGSGGLGAVLFDNHGRTIHWFGLELTTGDTAPLLRDGNVVIIGELEAIVPLIALRLWGHLCRCQHVVFYIDNEGAKFSLIRGSSKSMMISRIAFKTSELCEEIDCVPWFARVPTSCNVADAPSRGLAHALLPDVCRVSPDQVRSLFELEVSSLCAMAQSPHPLDRGGKQGEAKALDTPNSE